MFEFWNLFLNDADWFIGTIFIISVGIVLAVLLYSGWEDLN